MNFIYIQVGMGKMAKCFVEFITCFIILNSFLNIFLWEL